MLLEEGREGGDGRGGECVEGEGGRGGMTVIYNNGTTIFK